MLTIFSEGKSACNSDKILLQMIRPENKQKEIIFPSNMIDAFCKEHQFTCHQFAHTPEGDVYMRMKMKNFTVEYIVMKKLKTQDYNSYVSQIFKNGQLVYRRPDIPIGKILVVWVKH